MRLARSDGIHAASSAADAMSAIILTTFHDHEIVFAALRAGHADSC